MGWNRNGIRGLLAGIGIGTGIRLLNFPGIGIGTGIKMYLESCITGGNGPIIANLTCFHKSGCISANSGPILKIQNLACSGPRRPSF